MTIAKEVKTMYMAKKISEAEYEVYRIAVDIKDEGLAKQLEKELLGLAHMRVLIGAEAWRFVQSAENEIQHFAQKTVK